jgi:hypothetical protein
MKKLKLIRKVLFAFMLSMFLSLLITSCKESVKDKYVGTWQSISNPDRPLWTFKKVGDGLNLSYKGKEIPVAFNEGDGSLVVATGFVNVIVTYDNEKDRINVTHNGEYRRVK